MRHKILTLLMVLFTITFSCIGCGEEIKQHKYNKAIEKVEETTLNENGVYEVTKELVIALQNAEYTEAKNIIYMIGDGMGANIIEATQELYSESLYEEKLSVSYLTNMGTQSTYSANAMITDSAAGGTALATGRKTSNGTVAMNSAHTEPYKTVLELAVEKGKSTGIIATETVTDATPASFTAHVSNRSMQHDIARQQLEKISDGSLDLVLGGGSKYYEDASNSETFENAEKSGMSYSTEWEDTVEDELPLVGLFAEEYMNTFDDSVPTLAEMTDLALNRLAEDDEGFFLMIEGAHIDTHAEAMLFENEAHEMYQFDAAIAVALKFVALNPDTVIVVTADHETGGFCVAKDGLGENAADYYYLSGSHSSMNVPVYALGYGVEALEGMKENVDIAGFVASLLGEQNFEIDSTIEELFNVQDSKAIQLSLGKKSKNAELLNDALILGMSRVKNARAIHIELRNTGKDRVTLPILRVTDESLAIYDIVSQETYIDRGETLDLTYVLPVELWGDNALQDVMSMQLSCETTPQNSWKTIFGYDAEESEFEITRISVTDRKLNN